MIIKINGYNKLFIDKLLKNNINFKILENNNKYLIIKISYNDYKIIKSINYYNNIEIIKINGLNGFKIHIKKYLIDYIMLIIFFINIFLISNIIISIDIKHEDKNIRKYVNNVLNKYNIKTYKIKKSVKELNNISDQIMLNDELIEFISIKRIGMKYIVNVEERIINKNKKEKEYCNIISKKDAIINNIITYKGIELFKKGDKVKKGDIIISGDIILNEENKGKVCASGIVLGNTWYKVTITYPYNYKIKKYTKRNRNVITINNKSILKTNYKYYEKKKIFKIFNIGLVNEKEYDYIIKKYNYNEVKKLAIKEAKNKLIIKLGNIEIKDYKILNEYKNNESLTLDIFFYVIEDISEEIDILN